MDKGGKVILDSLFSYELISGEGKLLKAALKFGRVNVFGLSTWRWYGLSKVACNWCLLPPQGPSVCMLP